MNLGKFQIIEEIGHGGFGTVYRANDTTLDRIVALKVLHEQYLSDQKFIESFKREARMMARVSHPNVVQLFEVGDLNGQIYIAMQYFDAGNLDQKIQSGGPLPLKDAIRMLSQTARGLEAGHKIGLVHRDVKPANILYNREGYIAISDFGVAKSIQQGSPETTNSFNQFAGTPYYIPPELWKSEGNPSPAADVYSLACVFYEALTGEILFAGDTYEHVLTRHVLEAPVFSKSLPECLVDMLHVALAKNPSDRYQTMNDFLAAVRGALEKQARTPARNETTSEQASVVEDLPKPLAPGEITFEELVRRSQSKGTTPRPGIKPAPISQPTPPPVRPVIPTPQPQAQKTEPKPELKPEPPEVVPIIRPPQVEEQPEPVAEVNPSPETPETEQEIDSPEIVAKPEVVAEPIPDLSDDGLSEDESIEDFFARTSDLPIEEIAPETQAEDESVSLSEEQDENDLALEQWLTKEPLAEQPAPADTPEMVVIDEEVLEVEGDEVPEETVSVSIEPEAEPEMVKEQVEETLPKIEGEEEPIAAAAIIKEAIDEPPVEIPVIGPTELVQIEVGEDIAVTPTQPIPEQPEEAETEQPEFPAETITVAAVSASKIPSVENAPEFDVQIETHLEELKPAESIKPTKDKLPQTLEEREELLARNPATSKFDKVQPKPAKDEPKQKSKSFFLPVVGGIVLIALAFLLITGQVGSLFGGKPSATPTFTLTYLPTNTLAAPVILPTQTNTSQAIPSVTSTSLQISPTTTLRTPTKTATARATAYPTDQPTARPTNRPTNPPAATTVPPVVPTAQPTSVPPTPYPITPSDTPIPTIAPPTATNPPADTPIPTRGPTPTPP